MRIGEPILFSGGSKRFPQQRLGNVIVGQHNLQPLVIVHHLLNSLLNTAAGQGKIVFLRQNRLRQIADLHEVLLQLADIQLAGANALLRNHGGGHARRITLVLHIRLHADAG